MMIGSKSATNVAYTIFRRVGLETVFVPLEAFIGRVISWEKNVNLFLLKQHGNYFIDVGACRGIYEILLHKNFERIEAFEPMKENYLVLRKITWGMDNVIVHKMAVGDIDKVVTLHIDSISKQGNSILENFATGSETEKVIMLSLDTIIKILVDLIKVDVEGAEMLVLRGAEKVMHLIKSWIIEIHNTENVLLPPSKERKDMFELFMKQHGYNTHWFDVRHLYAYRAN